MLKRFCASAMLSGLLALPLAAQADEGFDYYVMALSWNAAWCSREGDAREADQCDVRHDHGFTLHGLWPQHERGWPQFCRTQKRDPSRKMTRDMVDIMGSSGLAWHQWKKHGRCTGLSASDYFALSREAYGRINRPEILRRISKPLDVAPKVIEDAFLEANSDLTPRGVTVTCKSGHLAEIRICYDKKLNLRTCSADVARDCNRKAITILPIR